eukprot:CAMPEP_0204322642 /NCGR_PEP_ID=MMETSP0469-20131031/8799_1 /ASSEMBLY_ACC=CAM_ASM_000384 /TAXON_ID=2969 /ORGANISM="Oxyrrhis marina" /LENGTH=113 /DNA_ID=CAMNT_0051303997 /DNA_START=62 /DNA_END=403 /DNA_ORIENTATION=+
MSEFQSLLDNIDSFKGLLVKHEEVIHQKKVVLQEKKKIAADMQAEIDELTKEFDGMAHRKEELEKTIEEAEKAYSRITQSTQTLQAVIQQEFHRFQDPNPLGSSSKLAASPKS